MRAIGLLLLLIFALVLPEQAAAREMEDMHVAVLRTIDKVSARTHTFEVPVDQTIKFGDSLFIKVRACRKATPLEQPESAAFLQIWERKSETEEAAWVFSGWMFASSPSLSAMSHPVYDVWVIDCKNDSTSAKVEGGPAAEAQPPVAPPPAAPVENSAPEPSPEPAPATSPEALPAPAAPAPAAPPKIEEMPGSFEGNSED